jgi:predicted DCC family thiol-disulfide oxidoreductase YuxK
MKNLTIFYDNYCPNCTKFVNLVEKIDWLKLIQIKQLRNELDTNSFREIHFELAKHQMASYGTKWHYGYNSLYFIFARLPLFWLFIPFLYLLKITTLGQIMYNELALKRRIIPIHCDAETCEV